METPPRSSRGSSRARAPAGRPPGGGPGPLPGRVAVLTAVLWAIAVPLTWLLGTWMAGRGARLVLGDAPPFIGGLDLRLGPGLAPALLVSFAVVVWGPSISRRWSWPVLLLAGWVAAMAFAVTLAVSDGAAALTEPLRSPHDYLAVLPRASADLGAFVRTYTEALPGLPIHVRGHPPGMVVLLVLMDRVGLAGAGWAATLDIAGGTSALVAVAITVRRLGGAAGESVARRAMPAAVLAPAAVWIATSPDAFFAGVLAWGVALLAFASTSTTARSQLLFAVGAGLLLGTCPFLSYGLLPMGLLALVVPALTRRIGPTLIAGVVVLLTVIAWAGAGFWIGDGIAATHEAWQSGRASARPYLYFLLADLVILGALLGPAGVGGLAGMRRLPRAPRAFVVVALTAAVLGALLGFERGEVERIWLPLSAWAALAAATIGPRRGWLVAQAATAVALQVVIASPW
jgi:hypothetical protein